MRFAHSQSHLLVQRMLHAEAGSKPPLSERSCELPLRSVRKRMQSPHTKTTRHSADVRMQLYVSGHGLPIAQLGLDFLILQQPFDYPPTNAEILLSIDGHEERWPVRLPDGISSLQRKTKISAATLDE